jgi:DNA-binding transcriptional MerR regulator
MTRNEQSERDVGENLAEARALCERLDETLKNYASFFSGSFTRRVTELEERVKEMEEELREKEEELREVKEELRNLSPTPLWKVVTDKQYKDIFETHILSKLEELSFRVFREVNTESRDACRRSGRKLRETFGLTTYSGNPPVAKKTTRKLGGKEAQYFFCNRAACMGNLALVRWLREVKKFDWNEWTINRAAENGHLHIVTYCMEQKCPRGSLTCAYAAAYGHLDILKYLHENGAPWSSWTCYYARENNHLECLVYALDNGCQNDKHVPQH